MKNEEHKSLEQELIHPDQEDQVSSQSDSSKIDSTEAEGRPPVTITLPEEIKEPLVAQAPQKEEGQVRVEPDLPALITGVVVPLEEEERAREQRNLDHAIHQLLIAGLMISASLMLFGLFLDLVLHRGVPTTVPDLREVLNRVITFRPSGFLALGLLMLIATPVLRVVGSILAFVYERDWRYAGITFLVFLVVILSIVLGKG